METVFQILSLVFVASVGPLVIIALYLRKGNL